MTEEVRTIIELTADLAAKKAADEAIEKVKEHYALIMPKDIELAIVAHRDNCPAVKATNLNLKVVAIVGAACSLVSPLLVMLGNWLINAIQGKAV